MMVTVHVSPKGVRLSRMTPHGDDPIETDAETRVLAALLWQRVAQGEPTGHAAVWPTLELLERRVATLSDRVEQLVVRAERVLHALEYAPKPEPPRLAAPGGR